MTPLGGLGQSVDGTRPWVYTHGYTMTPPQGWLHHIVHTALGYHLTSAGPISFHGPIVGRRPPRF